MRACVLPAFKTHSPPPLCCATVQHDVEATLAIAADALQLQVGGWWLAAVPLGGARPRWGIHHTPAPCRKCKRVHVTP